jgi:hypothetical protein
MPRARTSKAGAKGRSPKAPSPPRQPEATPRVRRRQKSARVALSKGTTVFETDHGPRAAWPASASKRRKR